MTDPYKKLEAQFFVEMDVAGWTEGYKEWFLIDVPRIAREAQEAKEAQEVAARAKLLEAKRQLAIDVDKKVEIENRQWQQRSWRSSGVGNNYRGCSFETFIAVTDAQRQALDVCKSFPFYDDASGNEQEAKALWLLGDVGTGKTHLAVAILKQALFENNEVPGFITVADLIAEIRDTWGRDAKVRTETVLQKYGSEIDLLVLDDVGQSYGTDAERNDLFGVIDRRSKNGKATIITSNLNPAQLRAKLGDRLYNRLEDRAVLVPLAGESYRRPLMGVVPVRADHQAVST